MEDVIDFGNLLSGRGKPQTSLGQDSRTPACGLKSTFLYIRIKCTTATEEHGMREFERISGPKRAQQKLHEAKSHNLCNHSSSNL